MSSIIKKLDRNNLLKNCPDFAKNTSYEVITGSVAYGLESKNSDIDIYSITIPPMDYIFPNNFGYFHDVGPPPPNFDNYQKHHIICDEKEYDITIFSIQKFINLCIENNPNMVDILFVPDRCVINIDNSGRILRENRKLFLSKKAFFTFKGYAFSQFKKMETQKKTGKRKDMVEKHGYDTKYAYHLVRLCLEVTQILTEGDLNVEKNSNTLKTIRDGQWTLDQIKNWFMENEKFLNELHLKSDLRESPDWENEIKPILLACIEEKHGSISAAIKDNQHQKILDKYDKICKIIKE